MSGTAVGVALAAAAAAAYEISYVAQAAHARQLHRPAGADPWLLARLARRPGWLGAIAISVAGFALQVLALRHAPLSVVQPVLALGLVLLLVLGRGLLGDRAGPRELAGAAGVVAGVTLLVVAAPARGGAHRPVLLAVACTALGAVALAPHALRARAVAPLVASAACADALAALATNEVARALVPLTPAAVAWAALAALAGLVALAGESAALQVGTVGRVGPPVLAGGVAIPVALAPLVAGDRWAGTPLGGGLIVAGLALVVAASALLGASRTVAQLRHPEAA